MVQFSKVLLAIDKVHAALQRALDCGPGLDLNISITIMQKINVIGKCMFRRGNMQLSQIKILSASFISLKLLCCTFAGCQLVTNLTISIPLFDSK